jgi:hypothetical protein
VVKYVKKRRARKANQDIEMGQGQGIQREVQAAGPLPEQKYVQQILQRNLPNNKIVLLTLNTLNLFNSYYSLKNFSM